VVGVLRVHLEHPTVRALRPFRVVRVRTLLAGSGAGTRDRWNVRFAIRCRDGSTYAIAFRSRDPLTVIRISPSICQIDRFVYSGSIGGESMATSRLLRNEILDPGGVYYVGDFVAVTRDKTTYGLGYKEHKYTWRIQSIRDNYVRTTAEMKRAFPGLATVVTEDRMSR
jgi:hypothetical protein